MHTVSRLFRRIGVVGPSPRGDDLLMNLPLFFPFSPKCEQYYCTFLCVVILPIRSHPLAPKIYS
jgi:hypothetical protein